tara:strand:+ start:10416 stop:10838 length:423 start_codon:yes stop_codon:yes gene_type:complete
MVNPDELEKAYNNEENAQLLDLTNEKIETVKIQMLKQINLDKKQFKEMLNKLKNYRYIDELPDLKYGAFIRWISLKNPEIIKLSNGGLVMEIKIELSGIKIVCKNNMNVFFQINMNENLIFQKLNNQENVLLSALDYINQ